MMMPIVEAAGMGGGVGGPTEREQGATICLIIMI